MNKGIIIGGPMDGFMLSHKAEVWDYHKRPESLTGPIDYSDMNASRAALAATSETGRYYYTDMTLLGSTGHSTGRRIGFWVQHDKTLDDALDALLARYQEPRKHMDLLRRAGRLIERLLGGFSSRSEQDFRDVWDMMNEIRENDR